MIKAIGFVNPRISNQQYHEHNMRCAARGSSVDLARTLAPSSKMDDPAATVLQLAERLHADTVIVPNLGHFDHSDDAARVSAKCAIIEAEHVPPKIWRRGGDLTSIVTERKSPFAWFRAS